MQWRTYLSAGLSDSMQKLAQVLFRLLMSEILQANYLGTEAAE